MEIRQITRNSARCRKCDTEIESRHRHDFVTCPCGSLSVDGGLAYTKRLFKSFDEWEDTSTYTTKVHEADEG